MTYRRAILNGVVKNVCIDDCAIFYADKNINTINKILNDIILIECYFNLNQLTVNINQTKLLNMYTQIRIKFN